MSAIFALNSNASLVRLSIKVAVGKPEAALQQVGNVDLRVIKIGGHEQAEDAVGVIVRGVQGVDIGTQLRAEEGRKLLGVLKSGDLCELGLDRLEQAEDDVPVDVVDDVEEREQGERVPPIPPGPFTAHDGSPPAWSAPP